MGRKPCCNADGLKKGAWTPDEDQKLIASIQEHGEGGWRTLPQKAGLQRCGKSCRLRWANYLRPDIKRGEFSKEEEEKIIQLHSSFGNRWSAIARHLPQRTDNEIKNYWNTHLKKRIAQPPLTSSSSSSSDSSSKPSASVYANLLNKVASNFTNISDPVMPRPTSSSFVRLLNEMASSRFNNNIKSTLLSKSTDEEGYMNRSASASSIPDSAASSDVSSTVSTKNDHNQMGLFDVDGLLTKTASYEDEMTLNGENNYFAEGNFFSGSRDNAAASSGDLLLQQVNEYYWDDYDNDFIFDKCGMSDSRLF